jgi:hypothetical protein
LDHGLTGFGPWLVGSIAFRLVAGVGAGVEQSCSPHGSQEAKGERSKGTEGLNIPFKDTPSVTLLRPYLLKVPLLPNGRGRRDRIFNTWAFGKC